MGVVDKDFSLICIIFSYSWGAMIFMKIPLSYENHLSTCQGWDFNTKIGTGSIFLFGPSYATVRILGTWGHLYSQNKEWYRVACYVLLPLPIDWKSFYTNTLPTRMWHWAKTVQLNSNGPDTDGILSKMYVNSQSPQLITFYFLYWL